MARRNFKCDYCGKRFRRSADPAYEICDRCIRVIHLKILALHMEKCKAELAVTSWDTHDNYMPTIHRTRSRRPGKYIKAD